MSPHIDPTSAPLNRRRFLQMSAAAATLGIAGAPLALSAAEPIARNDKPHMKLSLAAYSLRKYLKQNWPESRRGDGQSEKTLDDFIHYCAELDLDACELTSYYFPADLDDAYLMHIKELTFRLGLDISGTAIGNDFCFPDGEQRDQQLAQTRAWIDRAALMGAPVIRIFAGKAKDGMSDDQAIELCAAGIDEALEYAATKGVFLALENHGGITATPEQLLKIVAAVEPSPWFGINLDSGNFRTADPYGDLAKIAPYAVNAQIKLSISDGTTRQPTDLERVVGILRDANYRGYVVLEYEEKEDPFEAIPSYIARLRELTTC